MTTFSIMHDDIKRLSYILLIWYFSKKHKKSRTLVFYAVLIVPVYLNIDSYPTSYYASFGKVHILHER